MEPERIITINDGSLKALLHAAAPGPFMHAEILSLTGRGKLRVTCNWLYSSLNCDPNDNSTFEWQFNKIDDQHVSLSPVSSCITRTIYASVRDDIDYYVQVQAPYSADWITAVGRDEIIGFKMHDLLIAQFNGFNGLYLALNDNADSHGAHSGYRVRSVGTVFDQKAQWFIGIKNSLQEHIRFSGHNNSMDSLQKQLINCRINVNDYALRKIADQLKAL